MIETPTVFVLGAGSSIPYGFPSGAQLKELVVNSLATSTVNDFLREADIPPKHGGAFLEALRFSKQPSVDAFLELRPEFIPIGKAMIARELCRLEHRTSLFSSTIADDWHSIVFNRMSTHLLDEFAENRIAFITFNYDRSLEYALFTALVHRYGKCHHKVVETMHAIPVIHVHGQLGLPDWQKDALPSSCRAYEAHHTWDQISKAADGIKIICEEISESPEFKRAHEVLAGAKRVLCLGFAYAAVNMKRLFRPFTWDGSLGQRVLVHGSCLGLYPEESHKLEMDYHSLRLQSRNCTDCLRRDPDFLSD
jgi:hypothetical protein